MCQQLNIVRKTVKEKIKNITSLTESSSTLSDYLIKSCVENGEMTCKNVSVISVLVEDNLSITTLKLNEKAEITRHNHSFEEYIFVLDGEYKDGVINTIFKKGQVQHVKPHNYHSVSSNYAIINLVKINK